MKNILTIAIFAVFSVSTFAQVNWRTIEEAAVEQKKHPEKKLMVDLYTDWCGYCKAMDRKTFTQDDLAKFINDNFIPVKFNAEKQEAFIYNDESFELLKASNGKKLNMFAYKALKGNIGYPSYVIVDSEGKFVDAAQGYFSPEKFKPFLERNL